MEPIFKRVVLKISGEALAGEKKSGIDTSTVNKIAEEIKKIYDLGVEVAIVVGGGNFWRGRTSGDLTRTTSDYIGMLGTVMNGLALKDTLENIGVRAKVQSAINVSQVAEFYTRDKSIEYLENKTVVIFAAGTGNPYFSTDTAAALRAAEVEAEVILSGKKGVDGVYDADPNLVEGAKKFDELTYMEVLNRGLKIMDSTATSLCMENHIPLLVFGIDNTENIVDVVLGKKIGTVIKED